MLIGTTTDNLLIGTTINDTPLTTSPVQDAIRRNYKLTKEYYYRAPHDVDMSEINGTVKMIIGG